MLFAVLSGFLLATVAPWLHRLFGRHSGWALGALPLGLFMYFGSFLPEIQQNGPLVIDYPWVPGLEIRLSFLVDGLSLLFAMLISGIGFFIISYAGRYLESHRDLARFYVLILAFMASMLGLVLSNNLIALFVFWELTSITSYLLIGFNHEDEDARKAALQGLFVTVGGGLALLAGLVMLGMVAGSYELSEILTQGEWLQAHPWYLPIVLLIVLGAFTKSAQVPFHFWLPNAMAAPTPVSAYLHSATMVKAGVYLLARCYPGLGGTQTWLFLLGVFGAITMLTGIVMAVRSTGIKRVLAYSTVMALGTMTMLIGLGTEKAVLAAMVFLLAHALYKAALFLLAGVLDHGAGCKDFLQTGGLRRAMPISTLIAALAALSLAGVLPLFGFIAKELLFEATLQAPRWAWLFAFAAWSAAILVVAVAAIVGIRPWYGAPVKTPIPAHEAPPAMLLGPAVLALLGVFFGLFPWVIAYGLLGPAASSVYGQPISLQLALWHGFNLPLLMSVLSLVLGLLVYRYWDQLRAQTALLDQWVRFGPERGYEAAMQAMVRVAHWQTALLQNGYLRYYLMATLLSTVVLLLAALALNASAVQFYFDLSGVMLHEYVILAVLLAATVMAVTTRSRLGAVASLGAVGFGVALIYVLFSAPDVGITQILVETLTVILLVLVLFRLPRFLGLTSTALRVRDALIALTVGGTITLLMLSTISTHYFDSISSYFIENSQPEGYGRNIVNVILVDFRALDTLGEIFVLALAAVGVYAMIKLRADRLKKGES